MAVDKGSPSLKGRLMKLPVFLLVYVVRRLLVELECTYRVTPAMKNAQTESCTPVITTRGGTE